MQTQSRSSQGSWTTYDVATGGVIGGGSRNYHTVDLVVQNGNVQGDRKTPNPFSFTKSEGYINPDNNFETAFTSGLPNWRRHVGVVGDICPDSIVLESAGINESAAVAEAYATALTRLNARVRDGTVDASIDLFQLRKTIALRSLVTDLTRRFATGLRGVSKKRKQQLERAGTIGDLVKGVSDFRLAWVYGIKPTMGTLFDVVYHQSKHYHNRGWSFSGRAEVRHQKFVSGANWPWYYGWAGGPQHYNTTGPVTTSHRCEIKVFMVIPDNPLTELSRLTSLNPVSIAWELMPYSFVVDWFINIGDYLRDVETSMVFNQYFRVGYRTDTTLYSFNQRTFGIDDFPVKGSYTARARKTSLNRTVLSQYPSPNFPRWQPKLGADRLYNAAALIGTLMGSKRAVGRAPRTLEDVARRL